MTPRAESHDPELSATTRLSAVRTRLSHDRTLLAWVRTAISLITFGFTVYKFFQFEWKGGQSSDRLIGPRGFALVLIPVGLLSLGLATVDHMLNLRTLKAEFPNIPRSALTRVLAVLVALLGVAALLVVVLGR
jgi:putative membrane protein